MNCDGEMHCLKSGGVVSNAHEAITAEMVSLLSSILERYDEREYPIADLEEDKEELEDSEMSWTTVY